MVLTKNIREAFEREEKIGKEENRRRKEERGRLRKKKEKDYNRRMNTSDPS